MNVCIVAGARPNFVKVAPIIRVIQREKAAGKTVDCRLVYAGEASDPTLEPSLFADLQMPAPDVYLGVGCENLNELTGQVMSAFEQYLRSHPADVVLVVDDLASTMAAAIVTKKQGIMLAHLVAGTRSFDISMPKEINRLVIDGLSDLLFTAGMGGNSTAAREGAETSKVYLVGNLLMDTLRYNRPRLRRPALLDSLRLDEGGYIVFTLNRKALLADTDNLRRMVMAVLESTCGTPAVPVVAPLRQAAACTLQSLLADEPAFRSRFHVVSPLPYLEFGYLTSHAKGIVTDSGNVAEEATFNGVPCITLNSYTEHVETVRTGTNVLVGEDAGLLGDELTRLCRGDWKPAAIPDRWDGRTAERVVQILLEQTGQRAAAIS